jgi:AbrB family looped-hinge helix DNA binding protein
MEEKQLIQSVDELFRIAIPKEIRTQLGEIHVGAKFEFSVTENGILLKLISKTGQ